VDRGSWVWMWQEGQSRPWQDSSQMLWKAILGVVRRGRRDERRAHDETQLVQPLNSGQKNERYGSQLQRHKQDCKQVGTRSGTFGVSVVACVK